MKSNFKDSELNNLTEKEMIKFTLIQVNNLSIKVDELSTKIQDLQISRALQSNNIRWIMIFGGIVITVLNVFVQLGLTKLFK